MQRFHRRKTARGLSVTPVALLSVREVARQLGVSTATVYRLCEQRELHHIRVSNAGSGGPRSVPEQEQEDDMSANAPAERCALQLLCSPDHGAGWQTAPETCSRLRGRPERSVQSNRRTINRSAAASHLGRVPSDRSRSRLNASALTNFTPILRELGYFGSYGS